MNVTETIGCIRSGVACGYDEDAAWAYALGNRFGEAVISIMGTVISTDAQADDARLPNTVGIRIDVFDAICDFDF